MLKNILRRFLSLAMSAVMILALLPVITVPAQAAEVPGLTDTNIGLDATTNGTWTANGTTIKGEIDGSDGSCGSTSANETTLTIRNNSGETATLSFECDVIIANNGTITVDSDSVNTNGYKVTRELSADGTVTVFLKSGSGTNNKTSITIKNITLTTNKTFTTTFLPAEHGSYTVDNVTITSENASTQPGTQSYTLVATPAAGYKFFGWYNVTDKIYFSDSATTSLSSGKDQFIQPVFIDQSWAIFDVSGTKFYDLNDADSYASSHGNKIVPVADGILPAGEYTISSGNTLLIPFDDAATSYTTMPGSVGKTAVSKNQAVFRTLTMAEGAKLVVNGSLSLPAEVFSPNSSYTGVLSGKCGKLHMNSGSTITLNSGSNLYCWGFITGTGEIVANRGATVYEEFQINDYRGGSATSSLANGKKVFPFTQYFVQNIEAKLTMNYGATETAVCRMYSSSISKADVSVPFIRKDSGGMFNLRSSGSTFVRTYDPVKERSTYEISGDASLDSITISAGATIDSADFNLPIMQSTTVHIKSGTTTVNQSLCMIPGSELIVDKGATVLIASNKSLFVYDHDEWFGNSNGKFVFNNSDFKPEYYTPSRQTNGWKSTFDASQMVDVKLDINGTLQANGYVYTTKSGANITSSTGSGSVVLSSGAGKATVTNQASQDNNGAHVVDIPVTSAQLHNADGTYTPTSSAGTQAATYKAACEYCNHWYKVDGHYTVNLYVDGSTLPQTLCSDTNSVTYGSVTSYVKMKCDDENVQVTADTTNGLTVSGLTAGVSNVYIWTQAVAKIGETEYASLADAVAAYTDGSVIQMTANTEESGFTLTKNVYLDLNGKTVTLTNGLNTGSYKLYGMDSATDDYDGTDAGKISGTVSGTVEPVVQTELKADSEYSYYRYVAIKNGDELSFHRFNISVNGYRFELSSITPECALFFLGKFRGDSTARDYLKSVGFTLSDSNGTIATPSFALPADASTIPVVATEDEASDSMVVFKAPDTYLFEAYLIRAFSKETPSTYQEQFGATATVTFNNGESWTSDKRDLSYLEAWQKVNASEIGDEDKARLNAFLKDLGEDPIS